jgi:hypothetical protein
MIIMLKEALDKIKITNMKVRVLLMIQMEILQLKNWWDSDRPEKEQKKMLNYSKTEFCFSRWKRKR